MSTPKSLRSKVLNTLNILSGQDVTKTKLYQTILTSDEKDREALIEISSSFAATFFNFGKSLKTTEIYKWFEPIFNRFSIEEGIDLADLVVIDKMETIGDEPFSVTNNTLKGVYTFDVSDFSGHDYVKIWASYFYDDRESKLKKIVKIIKPLELFIITAITIMAIACHIGQKPFEVYANMDFKLILCALVFNHLSLHRSAYEHYGRFNKDTVDKRIDVQYAILQSLVNGKLLKNKEPIKPISLKGHFTDEAFAKIINVLEKFEYEKLKSLYKK